MNWLNKVSIKTRLLLLVIFPLIFSTFLAFIEIQSILKKVNNLEVLEVQLNVLSNTANAIRLSNEMRIAKLNHKVMSAAKVKQELKMIQIQLEKSISTSNKKSSSTSLNVLKQAVNGLSQAYDEYPNVVKEDVQDWSAWVFDSLAELILMYEDEAINIGVDTIEQQVKIMYQLNWILFWDYEADWLLHIEMETSKLNMEEELISLKSMQQLLIDKFINTSANPEQINQLLAIFQSKDFITGQVFRDNVTRTGLSNLTKDDIQSGLKTLELRLSVLSDGLGTTITQIKNNIKTESRGFKNEAYFYIVITAVILIIISFLGFSLINRIISYLKRILNTMREIENTHDYSIKIDSDGHDELSEFALKLNRLIEERQASELQIVKAMIDAELANKAKSSFLANMSHEIRTPLNGVIGMTEILSDTHLTPSQHDYLSVIETSSQTLLILINDILDLSKIESGQLAITPHQTNLREVIYDTLLIVMPKASTKSLDLKVTIPNDLPYSLMLDEHRLRQILMNLMSNSVKFTDSGSVAITLEVNSRAADTINLTLSVIDTGIGIDAEKQQTIFEPFTQEDGSITRRFGGTGLGLAISSQLVELMGGKISVNSEKGKGSRFYFTIDIKVDQDKPSVPKELNNQALAFVSNHAELGKDLINEIEQHGLSFQIMVEDISELKLKDKSTIILYFQTDLNKTINDIKAIRTQFPLSPIVVCQPFNVKRYDFDQTIDGSITLPILGQRMIKSLLNAHVTHQMNTENTRVKDENSESSEKINTNSVTPNNMAQNQKPLILVVEDNLVNQKVASALLTKGGYEFHIANNGREAVDKITSGQKYSAILMDCMMPIMDGFTATKAIRAYELEQNVPSVPIIALTASVLDEDIQHCFDSGMNDYAAKPFKKEILLEKIDKNIKLCP
ncbi:ATP-binding protein [uncultured Shewanella sp.]|uniref:ATP-binding protein n=1 Tax=uncultured Shewanella sp. TaxID=173975 RepID=UPI0026113E07|nr:ATP-binding protein [uncultured Shewanella sp.]